MAQYTWTMYNNQELPSFVLDPIKDETGTAYDFSSGWTFAVRLCRANAKTTTLLLKTTGITGSSAGVVTIAWATTDWDGLAADTNGTQYVVYLTAARTSDSKTVDYKPSNPPTLLLKAAPGTSAVAPGNVTVTVDADTVTVDDVAGYYTGTNVETVLAEIGADVRTDRIMYVTPSGSDSNDGLTWGTAKLTIAAASSALPATGGEIVFAGTLTTAQTISKSGITLRGVGRTSVIYVNSNAVCLSVSNADKVRLHNFRVLGSGNAAHTQNRGVQCINVTNSVIDHIWAESCGYDGILLLSGCTDNVVTACRVTGSGDDGINIGGDAVTPTARNVVANNVVSGSGSVGIHISTGSDASVVIGNQVSDCTSFGINTLSGVDGNTFIGNIAPDGIDILSNDNVLRGNIGTITDAGLRNTYEVDREEDYWWFQRLANSAETLPRVVATSGAVATGNQSLRLTYFTAQSSFTAANAVVCTGTTAAGATPTLVRVGVYTVASNGDLTLVASTTSDTALLASANTVYTKALSSSYAVVKGQRYALGLLVVTGATAPTVVGQFPGSGTSGLTAASPRLVGLVSSQSDLPSSVTSGSITNGNNAQYLALTA